jgi:hypothetical protein
MSNGVPHVETPAARWLKHRLSYTLDPNVGQLEEVDNDAIAFALSHFAAFRRLVAPSKNFSTSECPWRDIRGNTRGNNKIRVSPCRGTDDVLGKSATIGLNMRLVGAEYSTRGYLLGGWLGRQDSNLRILILNSHL